MEVLYCIITILFIIALIILMLLLFFRKSPPRNRKFPWSKKSKDQVVDYEDLSTSYSPLRNTVSDNPDNVNYEYEVHYEGQSKLNKHFYDRESRNETINDDIVRYEPSVALIVTVTSTRHSAIKTQAQIWDDDFDDNGKSKLDRTGVLFGGDDKLSGKKECDYWLRSPYMSHSGSFGIKRSGDHFVIFGLEKTADDGTTKQIMVKENKGGDRKKRITFKTSGTCCVGDICFKFEVPGKKEKPQGKEYKVVKYYDETIDDTLAEEQTRVASL